jgi:mono/diheme cytochrome c family protein
MTRIDPQLVTVVKRLALLLIALGGAATAGLIITFEVIGIEWLSTMEIQASFRPMEDSRPVPAGSVPIDGAAYVRNAGAPANPVTASDESRARGETLYALNCAVCHGPAGKGDGSIAQFLTRKPADLTGANVTGLSDGDIFLIISNGVPRVQGFLGGMPALRENLPVGDRWDVVNYVRSLENR